MLPFKKILWPTDFSEPSMEALNVAKELAENFSAELQVLYVIAPVPVVAAPPGPTVFNVDLYRDELQKSADQSLKQIIEEKIGSALEVKPMIRHGNAADEIVHAAEENDVDLIVIATHGTTGWQHLVFGSVAEKVVRTASCPVLTIHPPEK